VPSPAGPADGLGPSGPAGGLGPFGKVNVAMLTREYPPEVYGGAGVHVEYLTRELRDLVSLTVHCQGADRAGAVAHRPWEVLQTANAALQTISTDLSMAAAVASADVVHSHTWYANLAGHLAAILYSVPHVLTVHSLEPLRPWKEQLGGGYALSSWCERIGRIGRRGDRRLQRDARRRPRNLPVAGARSCARDQERDRYR
jgi:glycosyltransferase involved in cell wall biosynthesis